MGPWERRNNEKAKICSEYFANIFPPHDDEHGDIIEEYLSTPTETQQMLKLTSTNEIRGPLSSKKSPNPDHITGQCLKN